MSAALPVTMKPPPGREQLTFSDVELWCAEMRMRFARGDAPVRARLAPGGGLALLTAFPQVPDLEAGGPDLERPF